MSNENDYDTLFFVFSDCLANLFFRVSHGLYSQDQEGTGDRETSYSLNIVFLQRVTYLPEIIFLTPNEGETIKDFRLLDNNVPLTVSWYDDGLTDESVGLLLLGLFSDSHMQRPSRVYLCVDWKTKRQYLFRFNFDVFLCTFFY